MNEIEAAVTAALRRLRHFHPSLTSDDLAQEARLQVWLATSRMDHSRTEGERGVYLRRRALGAMHDAIRRAAALDGGTRADLASLTDELTDDWREPGHADTPDSLLAAKRMQAAAMALPGHLPRLFEMLMHGCSGEEMAAELGVSEGRISHLKKRLVEAMA